MSIFLRSGVRQLISKVMAEEVTALCGPKHHPIEGDYMRAETSTGRVLIDGQREEVIRPRVRQQSESGSSSEIPLETYQAPNDVGELSAWIIQALASGVSTREVKNVMPGSPGISKSNVSRLWQQAGSKFVSEFRNRDISEQNWVGLMLDGIHLSKDQVAVVALGITAEGFKFVLDFELGSSESTEVSKDSMRRLQKRGFDCGRSYQWRPYCLF